MVVLSTVRDSADVDLEEHFDECFAFINEAKQSGGAVLVHCFAGRSRRSFNCKICLKLLMWRNFLSWTEHFVCWSISVTVVIAYLMKMHGMNFSQAFDLVRAKRPQAAPNPGFVVQLKQFERKLQGAF